MAIGEVTDVAEATLLAKGAVAADILIEMSPAAHRTNQE